MLSGNGRHRRPRQAPAFLVAAGVTSAGVALPLLGASGVSAIEGETWDRVAECESGGDWLADGENGYFGGLQLPLGMWLDYGGAEFADRPDLASRSQQIAVAERVLADRGPRVFPGCALSSGLRTEHRAEQEAEEADEAGQADAGTAGPADEPPQDDPATDERTGGSPADGTDRSSGDDGQADDGGETDEADVPEEATDSADSDKTGETGKTGESGEVGESAEDDQRHGADRTGEDGASAPEASGGRHRGTADPAEAEAERERSGGGRHAARDRVGEESPVGADYRVVPGDSLSAIAGERGLAGGWPALYERNADVIGDDPDYILPGQLLDLDAVTGGTGAADEPDGADGSSVTDESGITDKADEIRETHQIG
jgi:hypothetical protein